MGTLAPGPRLHGREAEAQVLSNVLDRVAAGQPAVMLIDGEAGIGKTRLLQVALHDAAARALQVAAGRAEELERNRPFGLLAATLGCSRSSADPRRAAIANLLATHGDQAPVTVLGVDAVAEVGRAFADVHLGLLEWYLLAADRLE